MKRYRRRALCLLLAAALLLAGGFVCTGAVVSFTRVRLPLPEALRRKKGA